MYGVRGTVFWSIASVLQRPYLLHHKSLQPWSCLHRTSVCRACNELKLCCTFFVAVGKLRGAVCCPNLDDYNESGKQML